MVELVQIEGWKQWPWLRHGFSTRRGGVSTIYERPGDLNLGWTKEDDPALVAENRRRFFESVCGTNAAGQMVTVRQVHSATVRVLRGDESPLETPEGKAVLEGDGLMTAVPGLMLAVGTADCVPVLVVDTRLRVVAALHAGWRGTAAGITEAGVAQMREEYGSRVEDMVAAVGPSIGACCYAVGEEVREKFRARFAYAEELFEVRDSQLYVNLWEANRRQLLGAGLTDAQISVVGECTACARDAEGLRYFSHRGERGVAGRMLSLVGVVS
ncbi:laccase domain protein [Edaphobacter acidisoli]|uniref:Purine nucleoside phosphorylase n=1 Tax=Edaphobacter acidisoli TaxID=2040573 RepID=A0A916RRC0_9BACT|nr:peptidoglycan editing factor PgeF [Edaphobacter acidisoli]GGA65885.1 laccase domain protein [Edaphobacter acidisoli]